MQNLSSARMYQIFGMDTDDKSTLDAHVPPKCSFVEKRKTHRGFSAEIIYSFLLLNHLDGKL